MAYGVTENGFVIKDLATIIEEINDEGKSIFGDDLNTEGEDSAWRNYNAILSDRYSNLWQLAQSVYNAFYPGTSFGVSLDGVCALTGATRLGARVTTVTVKAYGTKGTTIETSFRASVSGDSDKVFKPQSSATIGDGTNEKQKVSFSSVPDAGQFTLKKDGEETAAINYNDTTATIETKLEALSTITSVSVTGSLATGYTIEYTGSDGEQDQTLIEEGSTNTLTDSGSSVSLTISTTQAGELPNAEFTMQSIEAGSIQVLAGTLTVIDTPTLGVDSITNAEDGTTGRDKESDAAYKIRREQTLQTAGSGTLDAIRSELLNINNVLSAVVFENTGDTVDARGRPAHSFECVVQGGDDDTIGQTILDTKPAGIETYGTSSVTAETSVGQEKTINFTRPSGIDIYVELDLYTDNTAQKNAVSIDSVLNNHAYYVDIDGTQYDYTSDATATENEILEGLKTQINAGSQYVEASVVGSVLYVESTRPGQAFDMTVESNLSKSIVVQNKDAGYFPIDGEDTVEDFVLAYGSNLSIGDNVKTWKMVSSFSSVGGINDVVVRIGTAASPTLDDNIEIDDFEIADFDSTRTTVKQVTS